jgi:PilZ domain
VRRKRRISATQVVRDIRSGFTQEDLQEKYKIALHRVEKLFKRLVAANVVTESELADRYPSYKEAIAGINPFRNRRVLLPFELIVYDITTSSIGLVRDISETGLRVAGKNCNVGDERTFQLPVDIFMEADPVLIVAKCQWVKVRGKTTKYATAGFEITDISDDDRTVLKTFVKSLSIAKAGYLNNDDMGKKRVVAPIAPSQDGVVDDREASLSTSATEAPPGLPSWFDEEAMKALQDIYRSGTLQEILAWWEAGNSR